MTIIRTITPDDIPPTSRALAEAFHDDPVHQAFFTNPDTRTRLLEDVFEATIRSIGTRQQSIDIATGDDGSILGAAIWETPHPGAGHRWRAARQVPHFVAALGLPGYARWRRFNRTFDRYRPTKPHWYLSHIGVTTTGRGQGIGSTLLGHRLAIIDRDESLAYLEATTPDSQRLYERLGFRPETSISSGETQSVTMTRLPQTPSFTTNRFGSR